jgi:hypothetical protein
MKIVFLLLILIPTVSAEIIQDQFIYEPIKIYNDTNLTFYNNVIIGDFLHIACQEDIDIGLMNCSDIKLNITIIGNTFVRPNWVIHSDKVNTQNIFVNKNRYTDYNNRDEIYVLEHNHDIIDYNPIKSQRLKTKPIRIIL